MEQHKEKYFLLFLSDKLLKETVSSVSQQSCDKVQADPQASVGHVMVFHGSQTVGGPAGLVSVWQHSCHHHQTAPRRTVFTQLKREEAPHCVLLHPATYL